MTPPSISSKLPAPTRIAIAVALVMIMATGWFLSRQLGSTWLLLGAHPEVLRELEQSLAEQRELAVLQPERATAIREQFDERQKLVQRLRILELNRERLVRVVGGFVVLLMAVVATVGAALAWVFRRLTHRRLEQLRRGLEDLSAGEGAVRVVDEGGGVIGVIAAMIEEVSRTVGEQRRRLQELDALRSWRRGSRRLGHEMRTPLTAIRLDLQRLGDHFDETDAHPTAPADPKSPAATYDRVVRDFDALRDLVGRITSSARLPEPKLARLDLERLAREFTVAFKNAWPRLELAVEARSDVPEVSGDAELLRQILVNLVSNTDEALEREPHGRERRGQVRFVVGRDRDTAFLDVIDDGPGVSSELRSEIFRPYVSGARYVGTMEDTRPANKPSESDRKNGDARLGLGLAISRMIALEQRGTLEYRAPEKGTGGATFRLSLPLATSPATKESAA